MSFQKCPICLGTGDDPFVLELPRSTWPCPTCKGTRIISELTGLPPAVEEKHNIFEPVDTCESDIQHKWICDMQKQEERKNMLLANWDEVTKEFKRPTQNPTQDVSNIQSRESQV